VSRSRAVLIAVAVAALGALGWSLRALLSEDEPSPVVERPPETRPDASALPSTPSRRPASERQEVRPPTEGDSDPEAGAEAGRLRGQVAVAPGIPFPARFEILVERAGETTRVLPFEGPQSVVSIDVPLGPAVLTARADGLASRALAVERRAEVALPPFRLTLEPAGSVTGQVLDVRGAPLAGLPVWLVRMDTHQARQVPTGDDGRFAFGDVPLGAHRLAWGSTDSPVAPVVPIEVVGYEVRDVPPQTMPELSEAEIRVTDRAGQGVGGARVYGAGQNGGWIDGISDAAGFVRARFLPPGLFYLNVAAEPGRAGQGQLEVRAGRMGRAVVQVRE
jgi:hypothetical protein